MSQADICICPQLIELFRMPGVTRIVIMGRHTGQRRAFLIADACVAMSLHRRVRFTIHQFIPILILIPLSNPPGVCVFRQSGDRPNTPPRRNGMEHTPNTASARDVVHPDRTTAAAKSLNLGATLKAKLPAHNPRVVIVERIVADRTPHTIAVNLHPSASSRIGGRTQAQRGSYQCLTGQVR